MYKGSAGGKLTENIAEYCEILPTLVVRFTNYHVCEQVFHFVGKMLCTFFGNIAEYSRQWWSGDKLSCVWTSLPFCMVKAMHIPREYSAIFPTNGNRIKEDVFTLRQYWGIFPNIPEYSGILRACVNTRHEGIFRNIPEYSGILPRQNMSVWIGY